MTTQLDRRSLSKEDANLPGPPASAKRCCLKDQAANRRERSEEHIDGRRCSDWGKDWALGRRSPSVCTRPLSGHVERGSCCHGAASLPHRTQYEPEMP